MVRAGSHSARGASVGAALLALLGLALFIGGAWFTFSGSLGSSRNAEQVWSEGPPASTQPVQQSLIVFPQDQLLCELAALGGLPPEPALNQFLLEVAARVQQLGEHAVSFALVEGEEGTGSLLFTDHQGRRWIVHWRAVNLEGHAAVVYRVIECLRPKAEIAPEMMQREMALVIQSIRLPLEDAARELELEIRVPDAIQSDEPTGIAPVGSGPNSG